MREPIEYGRGHMSDDVSIYGENDREFHSPFDLGFDPAALETVKWLVLGHLFYLVGLALAVLVSLGMGNVWMTPLFGVPLLWAGRKHRELQKILVFVLVFTAAHYAATWVAAQVYGNGVDGLALFLNGAPEMNAIEAGAAGGALGAVIAFAGCAAFKLFREGSATLVFAGFGVVLLAAVGSFGLYMYSTAAVVQGSVASEFGRLLWIYVPWQLTLAYILSKTLKPVGE